VVAGIAVIIPVVGPFLAVIPPVIVALIQSPVLGLVTLIVLFILLQINMNVVAPLIFQRTVSVHPVAGGRGVGGRGGRCGARIGALVAIPITAAISVVLDEFRYREKRSTGGTAGGVVTSAASPALTTSTSMHADGGTRDERDEQDKRGEPDERDTGDAPQPRMP